MTLFAALLVAAAQPAAPQPPAPPVTPLAAPAVEEAAIRKAIADVYAVISGPAGQKRDWARMRSLFTPGAKLEAIGRRGVMGGSVEDYITRSGPDLERVGFTEREIVGRVQQYGNLAHVWSSYSGSSTDGSIKVRGINSFQLARQPDGRWLVNAILWQQEGPQMPLPRDMERR